MYTYPQEGVVIGQGWDSFNEKGTTALCVTVEVVPLERRSFRQNVEQLFSSYSLITKTSSSISASYKGSAGKASGRTETSKDRTISTDDQNFLFSFESVNGSTFAVPPGSIAGEQSAFSGEFEKILGTAKPGQGYDQIISAALSRPTRNGAARIQLTADAEKLLRSDSGAFNRICGDGFVAAIHRGGRVDLVLTQHGSNQKDRDTLKASLSASGYGFSASASSPFTRCNSASQNRSPVFCMISKACLSACCASGRRA